MLSRSIIFFEIPIDFFLIIWYHNLRCLPVWWNWQTCWTQNPVLATGCGFDPRHRHHKKSHFCLPTKVTFLISGLYMLNLYNYSKNANLYKNNSKCRFSLGSLIFSCRDRRPRRSITIIALQKTKINPDRFLMVCRGIFISIVQSKSRFLWFLSLNIAFDIQNRRILYE